MSGGVVEVVVAAVVTAVPLAPDRSIPPVR